MKEKISSQEKLFKKSKQEIKKTLEEKMEKMQ